MKQMLYLVILILGGFSLHAQNELENIYLTKSVMHGGTADSGTSTSHTYTFVAQKTIKLPNILFKEEKLILQANDTLIITLISFSPYQNIQSYDLDEKPEPKKTFNAYYSRNSYHISVNMEEEFIAAATYKYKKKQYVAKRKIQIDNSQVHAAP